MSNAVTGSQMFAAEEYFRMDEASDQKLEYRNGQIVAISGGSVNHSLIIANCIGELRSRLKGRPCRVFDSNLRVQIARHTLYTYPDITVVFGELTTDSDDKLGQTMLNVRAVIEVLSPSSDAYDRGTKFELYRRNEHFQQYALVWQTQPLVELFRRRDDGTWQVLSVVSELDAAFRLDSIGVELPLIEIYAGVNFPSSPARPEAGSIIP